MVDLMMFVGILWYYLTSVKLHSSVRINLTYSWPAYEKFHVNLISLALFFVKWWTSLTTLTGVCSWLVSDLSVTDIWLTCDLHLTHLWPYFDIRRVELRIIRVVCDDGASGGQLKQKLDNLSDVSDNVRDRGTLLLTARQRNCYSWYKPEHKACRPKSRCRNWF